MFFIRSAVFRLLLTFAWKVAIEGWIDWSVVRPFVGEGLHGDLVGGQANLFRIYDECGLMGEWFVLFAIANAKACLDAILDT